MFDVRSNTNKNIASEQNCGVRTIDKNDHICREKWLNEKGRTERETIIEGIEWWWNTILMPYNYYMAMYIMYLVYEEHGMLKRREYIDIYAWN